MIPDRVASPDSLEFSLIWMKALHALKLCDVAPRYLAVQDGMVADELPWLSIDGIFVGGTLEWKERYMAYWCHEAHHRNKPCHVGRVGTARRIRLARDAGADSIDSCLPLWSNDNARRFFDELAQETMW